MRVHFGNKKDVIDQQDRACDCTRPSTSVLLHGIKTESCSCLHYSSYQEVIRA
jgi:hypothetical protein